MRCIVLYCNALYCIVSTVGSSTSDFVSVGPQVSVCSLLHLQVPNVDVVVVVDVAMLLLMLLCCC